MNEKIATRYQRVTCKKIIYSTCILDPRFKNKSFIEPTIKDVVIKKTIDLN